MDERKNGAKTNQVLIKAQFYYSVHRVMKKGEGPIPTKSSWSPVSGDHVFGSGTARQQAAAVGVAE